MKCFKFPVQEKLSRVDVCSCTLPATSLTQTKHAIKITTKCGSYIAPEMKFFDCITIDGKFL